MCETPRRGTYIVLYHNGVNFSIAISTFNV